MKKVNKVASILFAMALATSFISGCGNQSKSESSASTTSSVSSKSVSESSVESSKESSVESSSESSVESSNAVSESSTESSKESSAESSKEDSKAESATSSNSSTVEEKLYKLDDAIAYGKIISPAYVYKASDTSCTIGLDMGTLIAILSTDDPNTYDFIYEGYRYKIAKKCVELFPDDYVPDFSDGAWFTVSNLL